MTLLVRVLPGDISGKHTAVRRHHVFRDERDSHARFWVHGEIFQNEDVRVSAADQDDVSDDCLTTTFHGGV